VLAVGALLAVLLIGGLVLGDGDQGSMPDEEESDGTAARRESSTTRMSIAEVIPGGPLLGTRTDLNVVMLVDPLGSSTTRVLDLDSGTVIQLDVRVVTASEWGLIVADGPLVAAWPAPYDGLSAKPLMVIPEGHQVLDAWVVGDHLWVLLARPGDGGPFLPAVAVLVDEEGWTRAHLDIPEDLWPSGAVERGLVVSGRGGAYVIEPNGATARIASGDLVAVAHDRIYVQSCAQPSRCQIEVLDGQGRRVELRTFDGPEPSGIGQVTVAAPDGRLAYVVYRDVLGETNQVAVDGVPVFEDVTRASIGNPVWSPDGRWLAVSNGRRGVALIDTLHENALVALDIPYASVLLLFSSPTD
jgi:hypothetical protein